MKYWLEAVNDLKKTGLLYQRDWEGLGHLVVDAVISDPDAIEKILDRRYLTVSTGMSSHQAFCSDCGVDFLRDSCEHEPGVDGCFVIPGDLHYEEAFSYVVNPGDGLAQSVSFQIVNNADHGVTNVMTESLQDSLFSYPMQLSFTDAYGSNTQMKENTEAVDQSTQEDEVLQDDAAGSTDVVDLEDSAEQEVLEDAVPLSGASLENLVSELSGHEIQDIADKLVPAFSDKASLKTLFNSINDAAKVAELELVEQAQQVNLEDYVARSEFEEVSQAKTNLERSLKDARDSKRFMRGS
jgi:hypothetical protein